MVLLEYFKTIKLIYNVQEQQYILLNETMALCWILSGMVAGSYRIENLGSFLKIAHRTAYNGLFYLALIFIIIGLRIETTLDIYVLTGFCFLIFALIAAEKILLLCLYRAVQRVFHKRKNTIIIGNTVRGRELSHYFLTHTYLPQYYLGFFDEIFENYVKDLPFYLGGLNKVKSFCLENDVKEIYYAIDNNEEFLKELMEFADENFIFLGIIPNVDGIDFHRRVDAVLFNDSRIPVITSRKVPLLLIVNWYDKRIFDVIFSSLVLFMLCLSLFPAIALAIKLSSPGPILFKQ